MTAVRGVMAAASIAERAAILARVGAGDQATVGMVDPHRLAAAERTPHRLEHMAASLQCREGLGREGVLHLQLAGGGEAARRVHRLLQDRKSTRLNSSH